MIHFRLGHCTEMLPSCVELPRSWQASLTPRPTLPCRALPDARPHRCLHELAGPPLPGVGLLAVLPPRSDSGQAELRAPCHLWHWHAVIFASIPRLHALLVTGLPPCPSSLREWSPLCRDSSCVPIEETHFVCNFLHNYALGCACGCSYECTCGFVRAGRCGCGSVSGSDCVTGCDRSSASDLDSDCVLCHCLSYPFDCVLCCICNSLSCCSDR